MDLRIDYIFIILALLMVTALIFNNLGLKGRIVATIMNILTTALIGYNVYASQQIQITQLVHLDSINLKYIFIFSLLNLVIIIFNGVSNKIYTGNSIITTLVLIVSYAIFGATNIITFYLAVSVPLLFVSTLSGLNPRLKKVAVAKIITLALLISLCLLGISLFYLSTNSMSLMSIRIKSNNIYAASIVVHFVVTAFLVGIFPFSTWSSSLINSDEKMYGLANIAYLWPLISFAFIKLIVMLAKETSLDETYVFSIIAILGLSIVLPNIIGVFHKNIKKILSYTFMSHAAVLVLVWILPYREGIGDLLLISLIVQGIAYTSTLLIINNIKIGKMEIHNGEEAQGLIVNNRLLAILLLILLLSICGLPITLGACTKFALVFQFMDKGYFILSLMILIAYSLGSINIARVTFPMFLIKEEAFNTGVIIKKRSLGVLIFIIILTIIGGLAPVGISFN